MNALQGMDRYPKEVIQVSTQKHVMKVQYLYDRRIKWGLAFCIGLNLPKLLFFTHPQQQHQFDKSIFSVLSHESL